MENQNQIDKKEKDNSKKIIMLIVIVLIFLSLITSCSCTSKFFGKMGKSLSDSINSLFKNEEDFTIDADTDDEETISNQELKFDVNHLEIPLSDSDAKLSFSYQKIKPKKFTCSTSDASVATCYVKDGYVVVNPKRKGTVKVFLQTTVNGKIYEAQAKVTITDSKGLIRLSSNSGKINLKETNKLYISYQLVELKGTVKVASSKPSIATASAQNGTLMITALKKGNTTITVSIIYNGKEYKDVYHLTVIDQEPKQDTTPKKNNTVAANHNVYLSGIKVLNSKYKLNQNFSKTNNYYTMTVAYNEKNLSLQAIAENKSHQITYQLNGKSISNLNNLNLKDGDNQLKIIVANSGKKNTYVIQIHKPIRTVVLEYSSYDVYLGDSNDVHYKIAEDGKEIDQYNVHDISASLTGYQSGEHITIHPGYITVTPTNDMSSKNIDLNILYNNKNVKAKLNILNYYLSTYAQKYDMGYTNNHGEKSIILNTNLLKNKEINIQTADDHKTIKLCSKDNQYCIDMSVNTNNDHGNVELEYTGENTNSSSLPFKITANSIGISTIHVSGSAHGKKIADFNITINVVSKYVVTIKANGGTFNELENEYQFLISNNEEIDLSKYDEPYKINTDECKSYSFVGYSQTSDGSIEYNTTDKKIIKNLTHDLTLYAIYDTNAQPITDQNLKKTLWLDASLFYNEEYFKRYKEEKVIYPGAKGTYKMNIENESTNDVILTGMTLKEDNICIENKGCINMGYIIKYSPSDSNDWTYYYGDKNDKYWILNSSNGTIRNGDQKFKTDIVFQDNKKIKIKPKEEIVISIFWKWEEVNDQLDTLIGNHAAKKLQDNTINDLYGLTVGINFETSTKYCKNN